MKKVLLGTTALMLLSVAPAMPQQKTIKIGFVSTFSGPVAAIGNDMRNSFELALDHHRPQARRHAGRGDLRGRPDQARSRQAEDREADRSPTRSTSWSATSGRTCCWPRSSRWSIPRPSPSSPMRAPRRVAGELCSPYVFSTSWNNDQTPQAVGQYMNQKGVKTRLPDRPELRRRQGHAGRRGRHLQGQDRRPRTDHAGPTSSTSRPNCRRRAPPSRTRSSRSIRAAPASSSSPSTRSPASRARSRSTPRSPSMTCRCRASRTSPSAFRARSSGSTTCRTRPTRSTSPTTTPSIRASRRSTARRPMTPHR